MSSIIEWIRWLKDWTLAWAVTPYAVWALFLNAFAGSSFFPVPPDLLMITMALAEPKRALYYAFICLAGSTLGGIFGYYIGLKGGKPILQKLIKAEKIEDIHNYFQKYEAWAVGIAGFTPLPYKIFSISAGVFYVDFKTFVLATILSRGARFFIVGALIMAYGESIKFFIDKYFNLLSIIFVVLLVGGFYIMKYIRIPSSRKEPPQAGEASPPPTANNQPVS